MLACWPASRAGLALTTTPPAAVQGSWGTYKMLSRCVFEDEDEGRVLAPLIWQPLDRVHDYCGGHVALYFAWVGHTIPYHTIPYARGPG